MNLTRRLILKILVGGSLVAAGFFWLWGRFEISGQGETAHQNKSKALKSRHPQNNEDDVSKLFVVRNGTPEQNVHKAIEMMGGIEKFIGPNDVVILKPNCQWWNQGRTNLAAMKGFIDLVLGMPRFKGEIIIGENHHFMDDSLPEGEKDNIRGWTHLSEINGNIGGMNHNMNTLIRLYHEQGFNNVTKSHWRDGGPKHDVWGNGQEGGIVEHPAQGDGYVWSDEDYILAGFWGLKKWKVKMTYPIFTSAFSGITIDFKNGAFQRDGRGGGRYLSDRPVKFVNFAVLNDHGNTGVTSSIKNYMGITDLSCGSWGMKPEGYVNVHQCGEGRFPLIHGMGGPIAHFIKTIRKADLNIVTAEWVGWGHRTDIKRATQMRTILAGRDPISLDYFGAKHLVFPLSKKRDSHDPNYSNSTVRKFLQLALEELGRGTLDEKKISVDLYDFKSG